MRNYFEFFTILNCTIWVLLTFSVCSIFSIVIKLIENKKELWKVFVISGVAFCYGALSLLHTINHEDEEILLFLNSGDFTVLTVLSIITTVILSDLLLMKKGSGWKAGLTGLIAVHFGVFAVFYPIF